MKKTNSPLNSYARYSALALQMVVIILLGVWGGYKLDQWAGTGFPVFILVCSIASVALAIYSAIKDFIRKK